MTFAQFRRMKPKYQLRLLLAGAIALLLFVGMLLGISALFSAARTHLNTKNMEGVTPANILHQSTFSAILKIAGQDDPENLLVTGSRIVYDDQGGVVEFDMNLVNLVSSRSADRWLVRMRNGKTYMRRTATENQSLSGLLYTKLTFANYFPTLSRLNAPEFLTRLQTDMPVGSGGHYIFEDVFEDNINPQITSQPEFIFPEEGYIGYQVSSRGNSVGLIPETYVIRPGATVPYILSVEVVNEKKSKPTRVVLQDPEKRAVVLFEVGPWVNL